MTKAEKEKIFEIADMVKDIAQLDENSFKRIKFIISDYYRTKRKIEEVCKENCLDVGTFEHHKFIIEQTVRRECESEYLVKTILTQMFAEIDAEREKQEGDKNV